jgi:hypothetical protein
MTPAQAFRAQEMKDSPRPEFGYIGLYMSTYTIRSLVQAMTSHREPLNPENIQEPVQGALWDSVMMSRTNIRKNHFYSVEKLHKIVCKKIYFRNKIFQLGFKCEARRLAS